MERGKRFDDEILFPKMFPDQLRSHRTGKMGIGRRAFSSSL